MSRHKYSLKRAQASQAAQINRINREIGKLQQQGFQFRQSFLQSLKVTGTNARDAAKKAAKLKSITKSKLYEKVKSYTQDDGTVITGSRAGERGRLAEQRKRKQKRLSALDNVDDAINSTVDSIHPGGKWINLSNEKQALLQAWYRLRYSITAATFDEQQLNNIIKLSDEIMNPSDNKDHYDTVTQIIYNVMEGEPMPEEFIDNDAEEI